MLHLVMRRVYPRANENRVSASHPELTASRSAFFQAAAINFVLLQLLFFVLFCYLFGSLFQQTSRTHALEVLWVDYDGGIVGDAVRDAYSSLRSDGFPTLVERPKDEFPSERELREAVCSTKYWAALYTSPGSSEKLGLALSGSASQHNQSNVLFYIWNEARYPIVLDAAISSNLQTLSNAARVVYANTSFALTTTAINDSTALLTYANPWILSSINIRPTTQGTRTISPIRIIFTRNLISGIFTTVGSLLLTAAIWAFKAGWDVSGKQFGLNWLIVWLFAHVNFLAIDIFTIWLPPQYMPMALITWIVTNVTSILIPFSLSSRFYRWAYALPAHEAYEALTDNWSGGCNPHLHYALPILFAYEIIGILFTSVGVYKRCHFAVVAEEVTQEVMRLRVEAAMKLEREQNEPVVSSKDDNGESSSLKMGTTNFQNGMQRDTERKKRQDLEKEIRELGDGIVRMNTWESMTESLGPNFRLGPSAGCGYTVGDGDCVEEGVPQLVVINGDFITGENTFKKNSTDYVDMVVSPLVARHLPWASTYGNHDSAYNLSSENIYEREKTYKNSLTKKMVQNKNAGVSNYYLEVMSNNKRDSTPAMILWFFDSRGGNYYQEEEADGSDVARPNWVDQSVVDWFVPTRAQLTKRYKKTLPSYAFVHIPVGAMYGVQSPLFNATTSFEYTGQDKAFMKALLDTENLMGVFSGHDHGDDWCFKWDKNLKFLDLTGNGLVFCFGRHTGYGGYGSWTRGSRQVLVDIKDLGKSTKTWTRLEDGTSVGAVTLNSTYGRDVYPQVQLTYTSEDNEGVPSTTD
ncbi:hypothetical protein TrVFT333_002235 [Trichoderma virens FT-333]|nr:hypothetical protein TrVFT333_002235 [Trichoderma virens FT-333]